MSTIPACRVFVIAFLLFASFVCVSAQNNCYRLKTVRVGAFSYYPAIFKDSDGRIKGFYTEILSEIAKKEGWEIKYVYGSWSDGLKNIQNGKVDLLTSVAFTPERSKFLDYGKIPLLTVWSEVYTRFDSDIDGIWDLNNRKIAIMKDDVNGKNLITLTGKLNVTPQFMEFPDFASAMENVYHGKLDACVVSSTVGIGKSREYNLKSTGIVFDPFDIFFAVSKGKSIALIRTLDEYLEKWKKQEDSPYYRSRNNWTHAADRQVVILPRWAYFAILGLFIAIAVAVWIIFVFRREVIVTQKNLNLNKRQYQDIFEHSPVAICLGDFFLIKKKLDTLKAEGVNDLHDYCVTNPEFVKQCFSLVRLIDANSAACQLCGTVSKKEIIDSFMDRFTEKSLLAFRNSLNTVWNNELEYESYITMKGPQSRILEVMMKWRVGAGCEQDYSQIYLTLVDISELKNVQRELVNQKNQLAVTLSCITDAVITIDLLGHVLSMNPKAREITGWNEDSFIDFSIDSWYEQSTLRISAGALNPVRALLANKVLPDQDSIIRYRSPQGGELRLEHICTPLKDGEGILIGVILLLRDVTQLHKMMEQVQKTDRLESLGVLAGGIAHDFNNLLSGLFGYLDMATSSCTDPDTSSYLEKAGRVFERTRNLTSQLLTFTKSGIPDRKTGSVAPVVVDAVTFALAGKEIIKKFIVAQDLVYCDFDANQLAQVIDNITINAAQAMNGTGSLTVKIMNIRLHNKEIEDLSAGVYVLIEISDNGPGIPPENINRVFEPFFTTKNQGNGLGLATSFSIIRKHDGLIDVESRVGNGATFKIYLPASSEMEILSKLQNDSHSGDGIVFVMDDELYMRDVVANYLKKMGYTPDMTANGEETLQKMKKYLEKNVSVKGFLLDLTVPGGMGGETCIKKIREIYNGGFAIAMSGYYQDEVMEFPSKFGFDMSIKKPFRRRDLMEVLNVCTKNYRR